MAASLTGGWLVVREDYDGNKFAWHFGPGENGEMMKALGAHLNTTSVKEVTVTALDAALTHETPAD